VPDSPRPEPRKLPQQERSRALYDAILTAASELLEKQGPEFTLAEVASRAGVSPGSLYQYFPARASLIGALIDRQIAHDRALLEGLREAEATSPRSLAELLVTGVLTLYGSRPKAMSSMVALLRELGREGDVAILTENFCAALGNRLEALGQHSSPEACLDAARSAVYAVLGVVRQAVNDAPERLIHDAAFRARLIEMARAALTL
jgi:AcrR family transcriptional regulator